MDFSVTTERALLHRADIAAVDERIRDEVGAVDLADVDHLGDAGVIERHHQVGLGAEPFDDVDVVGARREQALQRDDPAAAARDGAIHFPERPDPDALGQLVRPKSLTARHAGSRSHIRCGVRPQARTHAKWFYFSSAASSAPCGFLK